MIFALFKPDIVHTDIKVLVDLMIFIHRGRILYPNFHIKILVLKKDLKTWPLETSSDVYLPSLLPGIAKAFPKSAMLKSKKHKTFPDKNGK